MGKITQWQLKEVSAELDRIMEPTLTALNAQLQMRIDKIALPNYITVHEAFRKLIFKGNAWPTTNKLPNDEMQDFYPEDPPEQEQWYGHTGPAIKLPASSIDLMEYTGAQKINEGRARKYHQRLKKVKVESMEAKKIADLYWARQAVLTRITLEGVAGATEALSAFKITCADIS